MASLGFCYEATPRDRENLAERCQRNPVATLSKRMKGRIARRLLEQGHIGLPPSGGPVSVLVHDRWGPHSVSGPGFMRLSGPWWLHPGNLDHSKRGFPAV